MGEAMRRRVVGDALDPSTHSGPVANADQFHQDLDWIARGLVDVLIPCARTDDEKIRATCSSDDVGDCFSVWLDVCSPVARDRTTVDLEQNVRSAAVSGHYVRKEKYGFGHVVFCLARVPVDDDVNPEFESRIHHARNALSLFFRLL